MSADQETVRADASTELQSSQSPSPELKNEANNNESDEKADDGNPGENEPEPTKEEEEEKEDEAAATAALFKKRWQVAKELVDTEVKYVQNLMCLVDVYKNPLDERLVPLPPGTPADQRRKHVKILEGQEISSIFCNVEQIYFLNHKFLASLRGDFEQVPKDHGEQVCVGKTFVDFSHFFKMYSIFCKEHERAQMLIGEFQTSNKLFAEFLKNAREDPRTGGFDIQSYLIMPIQRIPRLKMLLEELLKHTPADHPDFKDLTKGLEILSMTATLINEAIHERQNRLKVWSIAQTITALPFTLLEPHRLIVHEGFLSKICRKGQVSQAVSQSGSQSGSQ